MNFWSIVMKAIKDADVVLFILDARMPDLSRNEDLEQRILESGKEVLLVFNKADLISKQRVGELQKMFPQAFFVSVTTKTGVSQLRIALFKRVKKLGFEKLFVGVVGYPNVGKSAVTNVLSRAGKTKVSSKAGTTTGVQWASSSHFTFIDSPGVIPFGDDELRLGVLGAKNPEKLKNPEAVALEIIRLVVENDALVLEKNYGVPISGSGEPYDLLLSIGEARKFLVKGGVVDEHRTEMLVIRDWQKGKLRVS